MILFSNLSKTYRILQNFTRVEFLKLKPQSKVSFKVACNCFSLFFKNNRLTARWRRWTVIIYNIGISFLVMILTFLLLRMLMIKSLFNIYFSLFALLLNIFLWRHCSSITNWHLAQTRVQRASNFYYCIINIFLLVDLHKN